MKIAIDDDACTGHGRCYSVAPELFEADELGRGAVLHEEVPDGLEDKARAAASSCPERAVQIS